MKVEIKFTATQDEFKEIRKYINNNLNATFFRQSPMIDGDIVTATIICSQDDSINLKNKFKFPESKKIKDIKILNKSVKDKKLSRVSEWLKKLSLKIKKS